MKILISVLAIFILLAIPSAAFAADSLENACGDLGTAQSELCRDRPQGTNNPVSGSDGIILRIVRIISIVAGAVAVIMIMIGGLRYILSNGDSTAVNNAKNTILYAVIGLVVVISAQFIIGFVINHI